MNLQVRNAVNIAPEGQTSRNRLHPRWFGRSAAGALLLCVAPWALHGCGSREDSEDDVFVAMEEVYERFTNAYRLGEPDSVVVLYTDDPLYLPPQGPVLQGREALRGQFSFLEAVRSSGGVARISFESVERGASDDLAWDVGYYTLHVERPEGLSPRSRGKFTTLWRRDGAGRWRIHVDGFSPAPPPPDTDFSTPEP
jgi:uncharacterized protein (TIGR02246 family)